MESKQPEKDESKINEGKMGIQFPPPAVFNPSKSICKIVIPTKTSSGFFIKFFKGEEDFFCLMTNEHMITKQLIEKKVIISLYYDNETRVKEIQLNTNERYIKEFTEIGIDATVVEIISKDNISKDFFLLSFIDYMDSFDDLLDKQITIIQYPKGGPLSYADGKIVKSSIFKR